MMMESKKRKLAPKPSHASARERSGSPIIDIQS